MIRSVLAWLTGALVAIGTLARSVVFMRFRLSGQIAVRLYENLRERGRFFAFEEEITPALLPKIFSALCLLAGRGFILRIQERMLKAGTQGVQALIEVTIFRWDVKWFKARLSDMRPDPKVLPIYILQPWDAEKIGSLQIPESAPVPYLEPSTYSHLEKEIAEVVRGEKVKTGAILYGPPGNGKSFLVRYFALKYALPIYISSFVPDLDNHRIIRMFGNVKGPGIILLEDFDSYFDGRKCLLEEAKFTFDVLLNVLDGLFSSPLQLIFFMTANDILKVDPALRSRPSRFRFRILIEEPDLNMRKSILTSDYLAEETDGLSLDSVLSVRDMMSEGLSFGEAMKAVRDGELNVERARAIQPRKTQVEPIKGSGIA